jgi:hypothetical protein
MTPRHYPKMAPVMEKIMDTMMMIAKIARMRRVRFSDFCMDKV